MSRKLLVGSVLLGAGILVAVFGWGRPKSSVYARSVSAFLAHPSFDEPVRVQGSLVPGSLVRGSEPCEYRFSLVDGWSASTDAVAIAEQPQLPVRYLGCVVPDTFRDAPGFEMAPVTVEGKLCESCHRFEASQIYAKMPRKYEMKEMRRATDASTAPIGL